MDLEAKLAARGEDYSGSSGTEASGVGGGTSGAQDSSRRLPKGPAKAVLLGHRGPITSVTVHPIYR